jgi:hypothetical protein
MNLINQRLFAIGVLGVALGAGIAHAASQHTFVLGTGADTNPCSPASRCRTFAGALVNTLPGGEIDVLDTAGYGAVTINQAVSIVNQTAHGVPNRARRTVMARLKCRLICSIPARGIGRREGSCSIDSCTASPLVSLWQ